MDYLSEATALPTDAAVVLLDYGVMACWIIVSVYAMLYHFYLRCLGRVWRSMRIKEFREETPSAAPFKEMGDG